jgi:hypothetical protein
VTNPRLSELIDTGLWGCRNKAGRMLRS